MAVRPHQHQCGQPPDTAGVFPYSDKQRDEDVAQDAGPVVGELDEQAGGGKRGGDSPEPRPGPLARYQARKATEHGQQQPLPQHDRTQSAGSFNQIPDRLRQPLMREVEAARSGFPGVGGFHLRGRVRERIGYRQTMLGDDVAAGRQMPPCVGVAKLGGETAHQENAGERDQRGHKPLRGPHQPRFPAPSNAFAMANQAGLRW